MYEEIIERVNAKLANLPVYEDPMPSDIPQRELLELVIYANELPSVAKSLNDFLKIGAPIMICDVDEVATAATGKTIFSYHIEDTMKRLLFACRAGNFINRDL